MSDQPRQSAPTTTHFLLSVLGSCAVGSAIGMVVLWAIDMRCRCGR